MSSFEFLQSEGRGTIYRPQMLPPHLWLLNVKALKWDSNYSICALALSLMLVHLRAVDSGKCGTPALMNKTRSLCWMEVQHMWSKFNIILSAANWLNFWSLPEGPVTRALNFVPFFIFPSCDSCEPGTDPHRCMKVELESTCPVLIRSLTSGIYQKPILFMF